ncbi:Fc.00g081750.m01.CDS01 [Cosmosporella sp. VM-42]
MDPTKAQLIALTVLLGPLVVNYTLTGYTILLLRPISFSHKRRGFTLRDPSESFLQQHPQRFRNAALAYVALAISATTALAILTWAKEGHWSTAFGSMSVLVSILRETLGLIYLFNTQTTVARKPLGWMFLGKSAGFMLAAGLTVRFCRPGMILMVGSAATYRSWMIWEWGQLLSDTMARDVLLIRVLAQVATFGGTLAVSQSTSIHTELLVLCIRQLHRQQVKGAGSISPLSDAGHPTINPTTPTSAAGYKRNRDGSTS